MKLKKFLLTAVLLYVSAVFFSQDAEGTKKQSLWDFYETTDFAYYPKSEYETGDDHYAPFTGVYSGVEFRTTFHADYTIKTPLGRHWLVNGANLVLGTGFEISPISVKAIGSAAFSPVPFLVFSAGGSFGTGWNMLGWNGMAELAELPENSSADEADYDDLTPFAHYYYDFWGKGTFMFDTGAVVPGDWTHFVMLASWQAVYKGITGVENKQIWAWQNSVNNVNGWQYYASFILAYQMPLVLQRAGFMCELSGYFKDDDYGDIASSFNGDFMRIDISPLLQFKFGENDSLNALLSFSTRRSFHQNHDEAIKEPYLNYSGYEWFFNRIALSWTHKFQEKEYN